jgi:serine/threonine protein kinase
MNENSNYRIEDYDLLKVIRRGSHGEVWLARNRTGTFVAVKTVHQTFFESAKPFEREWQGLMNYEGISRTSPYLMPILHIGMSATEDYFYYVMELADDAYASAPVNPDTYRPKTLSSEIASSTGVKPERAAAIFKQVLDGIASLHQNGLIHRDIKPSNILSVNGSYCLADPGFISRFDKTSSLIGTLGYIPPEGPGKQTGDIFSVGVLLYELITGLSRNLRPELPTADRKAPNRGLFYALNQISIKASEPKLRNRYKTVVEVQQDLELARAGKKINTGARWKLAGIAAALLLLAAIAFPLNDTEGKQGWVPRKIDELGVQWDYKYSAGHSFSTNSLGKVVEQYKVRRYTEWQNPPTTYWAPAENDVISRLTYRFDFEQPANQIYLSISCTSWDFTGLIMDNEYGRGAFAIRLSNDGEHWEYLCNFIEPNIDLELSLSHLVQYTSPKEQSANGGTPEICIGVFDDFLPERFSGTKELWVQIQMKATGVETIDTFCPVQHLRIGHYSEIASNKARLEVRAKY